MERIRVSSGAPVRSIEKKWQVVCICPIDHHFNNDSSLPKFATTVPSCVGHFRIVPVPVFRVETKKLSLICYAQLSAILAIYNELRMRTTF